MNHQTPLAGAGAGTSPGFDLATSGVAPELWVTVIDDLREWTAAQRARLVVVSPHPDDETLGVGGLIAGFAMGDRPVVIVSVTDGEAAFVEDGLGDRRQTELNAALGTLSPGVDIEVQRLGIPDGDVARHIPSVADHLLSIVSAGDLVVAPLPNDGHPDHEAIAAAVQFAEQQMRGTLSSAIDIAFFPIWAWHWHDPATSPITTAGRRVVLSREARLRKRAALRCYSSQTAGPTPVLPDHFIGRFEAFEDEVLVPGGAWPS